MHAVFVKVNIGDPETAQQGLREQVIPRVKQAPGFVAGYWTRSEDGHNGHSVLVFDSEQDARRAAQMIEGPESIRPESVTLDSIEVREVIGNA